MMKTTLTEKRPFQGRKRLGFSLIEMLIVLAIIGMIVGLIVQNFGGIFAGNQIDAAKSFVENSLEAPLTQYKIHMGSYPPNLQALLTSPGSDNGRWKGPYIKKMPEDPWGRPYEYRFPGTKNPSGYDLFSLGPDGTASGDDIGNW
jgi:general secretion pathway protein G